MYVYLAKPLRKGEKVLDRSRGEKLAQAFDTDVVSFHVEEMMNMRLILVGIFAFAVAGISVACSASSDDGKSAESTEQAVQSAPDRALRNPTFRPSYAVDGGHRMPPLPPNQPFPFDPAAQRVSE